MNQNEAARLAALINHIRPEWPNASLLTFITQNLAARPYADAAIAFVACAIDPDTQTPKRLLENGPWWKAATAATGSADPTPTAPRISRLRCDKCGLTATEPDHRCGRVAGPTDTYRQARQALKETT